ncbi:DUF1206 domain-containing protein [Halomonas sp. DP8Y7-3]|uniref:DUF1206 domain-containing protein n=1 Tax=Halomonas sp. DP8Y7-3 TaxID=2859079 RepID=UPI001C9846B5|nr:DUF1206 domain-containing protein [Halomonas sp. DP8Y7-3]MBY5928123.1 DUF1206 domain-containing protein [Halomonas sp. DP8Y7-3]
MPSLPAPLRHRRRWIVILARLGYTAKGVVYLLIGILAALGAVGLGGDNVGTKEALAHLARQPFGSLMLAALVAGLYAYAAWRGLQGLFDVENRGRSLKALGTRAALVISGLIYASLGWYGLELLDDPHETTGGAEERTALLMSHPGGLWLVAALGLIFIGVGVRQSWRALTASYLERWRRQDMSKRQKDLASGLSRWGLAARGVVFALIGGFLLAAAWQADPGQAEGLGGALDALAAQPFGPWWLAAVAGGLLNYGTYCVINARFRQVKVD